MLSLFGYFFLSLSRKFLVATAENVFTHEIDRVMSSPILKSHERVDQSS